jgi:tellurium resistance protein TerD
MTASKKTAETTGVNLTKASPGLKKLIMGAGWEFLPYEGDPLDIDLCCFVLGRDGQTREDEDFVFYNNPQGAALSVKHLGDNRTGTGDGDDEAIMVDLDSLSFDAWRIVFVVSIYQGNDRDQSFSALRQVILRAENADSGQEINRVSFNGAKMGKATAIKVAELHRDGVEWYLTIMEEPVNGGLAAIAKSYGILISSTT